MRRILWAVLVILKQLFVNFDMALIIIEIKLRLKRSVVYGLKVWKLLTLWCFANFFSPVEFSVMPIPFTFCCKFPLISSHLISSLCLLTISKVSHRSYICRLIQEVKILRIIQKVTKMSFLLLISSTLYWFSIKLTNRFLWSVREFLHVIKNFLQNKIL